MPFIGRSFWVLPRGTRSLRRKADSTSPSVWSDEELHRITESWVKGTGHNDRHKKKRLFTIPKVVMLDHRLTDKAKLLASIFYSYQRSDFHDIELAVMMGAAGRYAVGVAIEKLIELGYVRTYTTPVGGKIRQRRTVEWIGPERSVLPSNAKFTKEKSAEIAQRFL